MKPTSFPGSRQVKAGAWLLAAILGLNGCERPPDPAIPALATSAGTLAASPRVSGPIVAPPLPAPQVALGAGAAGTPLRTPPNLPAGPFSLDFADTDVREASGQILGNLLHLNYTIDPAVHGTVTLHTDRPISGAQLLPTLNALLGSVGATLVSGDDLYRVIPATAAGAAGGTVVPLRYASAEALAKVLQPLAGSSVKVAAEPGTNALLVTGDPSQIEGIRGVISSFDVDVLAGQSYAVLPVTAGTAHDFADALQEAFRGRSGAALAGLVRVVPLTRMNAVLIASSQPQYIEAARRVYALVDRERRATVRSWHVYYLQNSNANDIVYTLQSAFTPDDVTVQPSGSQGAPGTARASYLSGGNSGGGLSGLAAGSGIGSGSMAGSVPGRLGALGLNGGIGGFPAGMAASQTGGGGPIAGVNGAGAATGPNPLLGGIDQQSGTANPNEMRILPNAQNNAVLVFATPQEEETILAMLRKLDIMPLQVRIDAVIAEVTLNDALQYGTQFFFKSGGLDGVLSNAPPAGIGGGLGASTPLSATVPGFILGGSGVGGAPFAISALQAVTTVNVLSSPQITVVDNQPARLQVGALVPYLTSSSQSTLIGNAPVINSVGYQPTGVILEVTPRVNSGGLVTLDITQEVSDVSPAPNASGINSPTFNERNVTSRVVVQDGQTIGLAGLIQDSITHGNQGIPWLKDIPVLGALAGTQNNNRQRTELLVMITPHVIRNQADVRALSEDMREGLMNAAAVPTLSRTEKVSGSPDPNQRLRERLRDDLSRPAAGP
jgi:general secretion pathway protein D